MWNVRCSDSRGVVPDDPHTVRQELRAERAGCARRPELGGGAGAVRAPVLADADLVDRLTVAQRDLAERAGEVAVEGERDRFVDDERPVLLHHDVRPGVGEGEALRVRSGRDDQRDDGEGRRQNCTRGASRTGSSISKNGLLSNPNTPATRFVGTVWRAFS